MMMGKTVQTIDDCPAGNVVGESRRKEGEEDARRITYRVRARMLIHFQRSPTFALLRSRRRGSVPSQVGDDHEFGDGQ